jgi:hypothetical protein
VGNVFFSSANELATLNNTFKVAGVLTDPTAVSLVVTSPGGTVTTATPTRVSTGVYTHDVSCDEAGEWQAEWVGTGAATDTEMVSWTVFETDVGKLYVTVQALKSRLGIANTADDYELHAACFSVSRMIEQWCDRHFWKTASTEARTFVPDGFYSLVLPEFSEIVSVTSLQTDSSGDGVFETTWSTSDYQLWPPNPTAGPETRPYTEIRAIATNVFPILFPGVIGRDDRVKITGVFGWPQVPWGVRQAALILAAEAYKAKDAPFGLAGEGEFAVRHYESGVTTLAQRFLQPYIRTPVRIA